MPSPTRFPDAQDNGLFFSDYTGLAAGNNVHQIWMDTRSPDLVLSREQANSVKGDSLRIEIA